MDGTDLFEATHDLDPAETLFIVCSKTFTTIETLTNARSARQWLLAGLGGDEAAVARHFVAVSTNAEKVAEFGIDPANMFEFWDWVGGRYSYDSAIGLSLMVAIGPERFREMLAGFHAMDEHFRTAPFDRNLPVILGLIGLWYDDFLGAADARDPALQPVPRPVHGLPPAARHGEQRQVRRPRGTPGRGPDRADRLGHARARTASTPTTSSSTRGPSSSRPTSSGSSTPPRSSAGRRAATRTCSWPTSSPRRRRSRSAGPPTRCAPRASPRPRSPHRTFAGNHPTNTILADRLDPRTLGALVALYEHKVFTQGTIWGIDSFDQWGVELGKSLAVRIAPELVADAAPPPAHDSSTNALIRRYRRGQGTRLIAPRAAVGWIPLEGGAPWARSS